MILGHITATYALREPLKDKVPALKSPWPVLAGALLPDLIDKPLALITGMPGRAMGHSVIILLAVFVILYRIFPRNRMPVEGVFLGAMLHIAEDLAATSVALWPLLGAWPVVEALPVGERIYAYYFHLGSPAQGILEFASYPFFLWFLVRGYLLKKGDEPEPAYETGGG